jgi:hypothetical protein
MPSYNPPLRDIQFLMHEVFKVTEDYQQMTAHAETDADTINAVLEEAGKFAANVTFPLNISGDAEGCVLNKELVNPLENYKRQRRAFRSSRLRLGHCTNLSLG